MISSTNQKFSTGVAMLTFCLLAAVTDAAKFAEGDELEFRKGKDWLLPVRVVKVRTDDLILKNPDIKSTYLVKAIATEDLIKFLKHTDPDVAKILGNMKPEARAECIKKFSQIEATESQLRGVPVYKKDEELSCMITDKDTGALMYWTPVTVMERHGSHYKVEFRQPCFATKEGLYVCIVRKEELKRRETDHKYYVGDVLNCLFRSTKNGQDLEEQLAVKITRVLPTTKDSKDTPMYKVKLLKNALTSQELEQLKAHALYKELYEKHMDFECPEADLVDVLHIYKKQSRRRLMDRLLREEARAANMA